MNNKNLGEVTKETRTLRTHLNGYYPTETAVMEYRSDYLGRMQWIVYPDGEKVTYGYDQGGQVVSVTGENFGNIFEYVKDIGYDEYGQRVYIEYGNGVKTEYTYDQKRRWLDTIKTENKWGQSYQNISYSFDAVGNVLGYENNCLDNVTGNYKTRQTYSYDNLYQLIKVEGETTYNPYRSSVPEFVSNYSQDFVFDEFGLGNMTSKVSKESVRPQKKIGDNLNYRFDYIYDENFAHRLVRAGDRYYKYDSNGNIICEQDGSFESNGNDTAYHKIEQETDDVYSTDYGWGLFKEDKTGSTTSRYRRTYTWNERNQLISSVDANYSTAYVYGQDGQRTNKYTGNSETLYFNKMWTHHTDSGNSIYGGQTSKNIYLGETRIVTKLNSGEDPTYQEEYYKQYFYHSDHLGSASLISDYNGNEYQRIEYTPYGETWVEKTSNTGLEYLPYKFTAKELDEETGLYYYGARYLDPRYSMWLSTDPALSQYMAGSFVGCGGIYNHINLNLYNYCNNNPIKYIDPDGLSPSDYEAACIAKDIYDYAAGKELTNSLPGGWKRERIQFLSNGTEGGVMGFYSRTIDGKKEYTIANKGTNPFFMPDWEENIMQPFGISEDMKLSIAYANEFVKDNPNTDITFTGHSKGGAEAAANAVATGKNAIIFNPATVNLKAYGLDGKKYEANMMAYIVKGEILNNIFGKISTPIDAKTMLPTPFLSIFIGCFSETAASINSHSMNSVIKGLKKKGIK